MAIDFPTSPTAGQLYAYLGTTYQWDSTHWTSIGGANPGVVVQVFSANGTYTPSPGMHYALIECVGSGASGGGCASSSGLGGGGGGGGGAYARKLVTAVSVGASQSVTIQDPGAQTSTGNVNGGNGGDAFVGALCLAKGGSLGTGAPANISAAPGSGGDRASCTGDFAVSGLTGQPGMGGTIATLTACGGAGGASALGWGSGGKATHPSINAQTGWLYGGGGAGGSSQNSNGDKYGAAGGKGIVVVTEFIGINTTPLTTIDNTIARFNGTSGAFQGSGVIIDDSDGMLVSGATQFSNQITVGYVPSSLGGLFLPLAATYGKPSVQAVTSSFAVDTLYINPAGGAVTFSTAPTISGSTLAGTTQIASGSLSGTALNITSIPQTFSYLVLRLVGVSTNATEEICVRVDSDNGASFDSSAGSYRGHFQTGTTHTVSTLASMMGSTTITAAQVFYGQLLIFSYSLGAATGLARYCYESIPAGSTYYWGEGYYEGTMPINAIQVVGSTGGTFDAGTYALHGVR